LRRSAESRENAAVSWRKDDAFAVYVPPAGDRWPGASASRDIVLNILGALAFVGFLGLLARVHLAAGAGPRRRRAAVQAFLLYGVAASAAAGLAQRDLWPFARWPMAAGLASARGENTRLLAVDQHGVEWVIDSRAWQPLGFDELNPWMHRTFPRLGPSDRDLVARHLLEVAEGARQRARAGGDVGYFGRHLGPLAAPYFDLHPRTWSSGPGTPPETFRRLRVYRESWDHEERRRDPGRTTRVLIHEYPRP
jgi:hypothetical protein